MNAATTFDVVIAGGDVVDGLGGPARRADVGVVDGRIAAVGALDDVLATRRIDATNRLVAPGFIDVHSHDDASILVEPTVEWKIRQGVTTQIVGNCGFGAAPHACAISSFGAWDPATRDVPGWDGYAGFRRRLEDEPASTNVAFLVGHGTARFEAMGLADRDSAPDERAMMAARLEEGLAAGALGMSSGLIYDPGRFAPPEELIALARIAGEAGALYTTHMRDEGDHLVAAVEEALGVGVDANVGVQISHHKAYGPRNFGKVGQTVPLIEQARSQGLEVNIDVYPYTASSTMLAAMLDNGFLAPEGDGPLITGSAVMLGSAPGHPDWEGATLDALANRWGLDVVAAAHAIVDAIGDSAMVVVESMSADDLGYLLEQPFTMIGSDGVKVAGTAHPRLYGTFPRVLGRFVRDGTLALPDAVRRMTSLPAAAFGLSDRGRIALGCHADLVVFDPRTIIDTATFTEPDQAPDGIDTVVVNGRVVWAEGEHTGARVGHVVTRS